MKHVRLLSCFIFFFGFIVLPSTADATVVYNPAYSRISVSSTEDAYNMQTLYATLVSQYNESYVKENILNETSPKIWKSKALWVYTPDSFYVNGSDTSELRVCNRNAISQAFALYGNITLSNVSVSNWNCVNDTYNDFGNSKEAILFREAHNVEFRSFARVYFGYNVGNQYDGPVQNMVLSNLTLRYTKYGLHFPNANNITVRNVLIRDGGRCTGGGIVGSNANNSAFLDITVINASDKDLECTGLYGFQNRGDNVTVNGLYIKDIAYSGTNIGGNYWNVSNAYVENAHHNGFEVSAQYSNFDNITVTSSADSNFFQVGTQEDNITVGWNNYSNLVSKNLGSGYGFMLAEGSHDTIIRDSYFETEAIYFIDSENNVALNITQNGMASSLMGVSLSKYGGFYYNRDHKIIDSRFFNNTWRDIQHYYGERIKYINLDPATTITRKNDDYYKIYYPDFLIKTSQDNLLENITLVLVNEMNSSVKSTDGWGNDKSIFTTASDGRTALPNTDRANSPAIADYYATSSSGTTYFNWTISAYDTNNIWTNIMHTIYPNGTIIQQQPLAQVTSIRPNSSWYRLNPNTPTNTISMQINHTKTGISAVPSANHINITVNNWNVSAASTINFTVDTLNGNNVVFTANLKPYASYLIKKDNVDYTIAQANSSGKITFNNSIW